MEQTDTRSTQNSGFGATPQTESAFTGRHPISEERPKDVSTRTSASASQDLARELDKLLDRIPMLSGESLEKAKADFIDLAARSGNTATELAAKSADVARRVTGRVKDEWETGRERAESLVHANPIRALGVALGVGAVLGAIVAGSSHRHNSTV
ncbi:hypothetical protein D9M70_408090 [compost metagenome]